MASFVFNWKEEEWAREQPSALQLAGGHLSKATMEGMLGAAGPTLPKWSALEKLPSSPERRGRLPLGQAALGGGRWLSLTWQSRGGDVQLPRECEGREEGRPDFDPALAGVPSPTKGEGKWPEEECAPGVWGDRFTAGDNSCQPPASLGPFCHPGRQQPAAI